MFFIDEHTGNVHKFVYLKKLFISNGCSSSCVVWWLFCTPDDNFNFVKKFSKLIRHISIIIIIIGDPKWHFVVTQLWCYIYVWWMSQKKNVSHTHTHTLKKKTNQKKKNHTYDWWHDFNFISRTHSIYLLSKWEKKTTSDLRALSRKTNWMNGWMDDN